ncbi:hypothetical protein LTR51_000535 [Lithohypha guttulata]|nr:hypothetical protein LTR51_000535 [Lithohypha guttulata]
MSLANLCLAIASGRWPVAITFILPLFSVATIMVAVYRLYFHSLADFPGPKIAAMTGLYELWYDVVKQGQYVHVIEQMHIQYGPIVRINPNELSVRDAQFFDKLHSDSTKKRTHIPSLFSRILGLSGSMVFAPSHEIHRGRRKAVEPFFSRHNIERIEPMIVEQALLLDKRLNEMKISKRVVRLEHAFFAFASDVVGRVCCEIPSNFLQDKDFFPQWYSLFERGARQILPAMHLPLISVILKLIPQTVALKLYPLGATFTMYMTAVTSHIIHAKNQDLSAASVLANPRSSIFRYIVCEKTLPKAEQSVDRLSHEAATLLGAGALTLARSLSMTFYHILANPTIREKLAAELAQPLADIHAHMPRRSELERLPYLRACVREGLRLSYLQLQAVPHCSPDVEFQYHQYTIPKATPIRMSIYFMHTDLEIFPAPFEFLPERWLGKYNPQMDRQFVPFSKGSRNCVGFNLAWAELYILTALLFRPEAPTMQLFNTDASDIRVRDHCFIPLPKSDSRGVRVTIE